MTAPMPDLDKLARGLTEAHREAISNATDLMSTFSGYPFLTVRHTGEPWPQGITQFLTLGYDRLTPLGLALKAHIERNEG